MAINKADLNPEMAGRIKDLSEKYGAGILGEIPYDNAVTRAQMKGLSVVEFYDGPVADAVKTIWNDLQTKLG